VVNVNLMGEVCMKQMKRRKLQRSGFKVGSVKAFLGLSDAEMALIESRVRGIELLKSARNSKSRRK